MRFSPIFLMKIGLVDQLILLIELLSPRESEDCYWIIYIRHSNKLSNKRIFLTPVLQLRRLQKSIRVT
jgi:hypothetical protein